MRTVREAIRAIIQDDALYKRRDLPGDVDDPDDDGHCGCGCNSCSGENDYVKPRYALYSMIGDAIEIYDSMENDEFEDDNFNSIIMKVADTVRKMKR